MKQHEKQKNRIFMLIAGNLLIGVGVAFYRLSLFGTDAYSCMNLGISGFIGLSFGTWQLFMNLCILAAVFFTVRRMIGPGTVLNMVLVGYMADFLCWLMLDVCGVSAGLPLRLVFLAAGSFFSAFGCALYITADMGVSPYDSVAFIIAKLSGERIPFSRARVLSDVTVVAVGIIFCLLAGNQLWEIVGLGTILNALCNGPLIQFFRTQIENLEKKHTRVTNTQKAAL